MAAGVRWHQSSLHTLPETDMNMQTPININHLLGQFLDQQEQWEESPQDFKWDTLKALAAVGANCYNEGNGPSFQILSIDGMLHGEFHLRFLEYSLEAGFDPFKLVRAGSGHGVTPVFGHEALAEAAPNNPWSAKMLAALHEVARKRFGAGAEASGLSADELAQILARCRDSIPADLYQQLSA